MTKKCGFKFSGILVLVSLFGPGSGAPSGFGLTNPLYAQPYPYKKYENRKEGIVKKKQLVAGEKLVLISATIENLEAMPQGNTPAVYRLRFYLNQPGRVKIQVREFDKSYKMQPLQETYAAGPAQFSWPAEIPRYYRIGLHDLFPLAKTRATGKSVILPIVLFYERPRNPELSYRFCFMPQKAIARLEYRVFDVQTQALVFQGQLTDLPGEQMVCIRWHGKDLNGDPVGNGTLLLNVKATFRRSPGSEVQRVVTLNNTFSHLADYSRYW